MKLLGIITIYKSKTPNWYYLLDHKLKPVRKKNFSITAADGWDENE